MHPIHTKLSHESLRLFAKAHDPRTLRTLGLALLALGSLMGAAVPARAQTVSSLSFSPSAIISGGLTTGTVTLSAPAPAGGAAVAITQNGTTYGTATVPAGLSSLNFQWEWFESQSAAVPFVAKYTGSMATGIINVTYAPWTSIGIGVAGDGTSRVLSVRNDGVIGIWSFDDSDAQTSFGTTVGHAAASQGAWAATSVAAASDGTSRVLWVRSDGAFNLWTMDVNGLQNKTGPVYGPYSGNGHPWTPKAVGVAGDGTTRVLWTRSDGAAGLWTLDANGNETAVGPTYGPYSGWTATAIGVGSDGTSRVLWTQASGAAGLWSFSASDSATMIGPAYGPVSSPGGTWAATAVGVSGDGTSRVLWTRPDGAAGLWSFGTDDVYMIDGAVYGPYSDSTGLWSAKAISVASDGTARVLWTRPNTSAGIWSFGTNDTESLIGPVYGPY